METIHHSTGLWRWSSANGNSWVFATIDGEAGQTLSAARLMRKLEAENPRGFGMIKVRATIGGSSWSTSVFPQKTDGWLLPIKSAIRRSEKINLGDTVKLTLEFSG